MIRHRKIHYSEIHCKVPGIRYRRALWGNVRCCEVDYLSTWYVRYHQRLVHIVRHFEALWGIVEYQGDTVRQALMCTARRCKVLPGDVRCRIVPGTVRDCEWLWRTVSGYEVVWSTARYSQALWWTVSDCDGLWEDVTHCEAPNSTLRHCAGLWVTVTDCEGCEVLWGTTWYLQALWWTSWTVK